MTYPDCYEQAEHRRALGKVLDDLKAVVESDAEAERDCAEQHTPETITEPQPDPVVQVRSILPDAAGLVREPVN